MINLKNKTAFITGGSRGIGLEIGKKLGSIGANIVIASKTTIPTDKLPGTIFTAAKEIEAVGGNCLPLKCDIRFEEQIFEAVEAAVKEFGGIDFCINNASAIVPLPTPDISGKKYDLMHQINGRGTFLTTKFCVPFLKKSDHPHVLTLSPPIDLNDKWFFPHLAYTMSKMSMSLCTLGHAREFKKYGIGVNSLWPLTAIDTSAVRNILGGREIAMRSRKPTIMADAAIEILKKSPVEFTGNFLIDELVLRECGYNDFQKYLISDEELIRDFFIPDEIGDSMLTKTTSIYK